ncbi:GNAT family N-acetyltransferase [Nocardia farcinica]|uniref:GNAT family N-acetyltransferase n=1 Tax=Nocardia farcinica TaxID=37329 RepID=UPI00189401E8|nr:GNAT family N-acetyltransferase [Nocardia farcinica]MBF6254489.1 GNAT family N-acetyltransferase [Nocardia farcinica]
MKRVFAYDNGHPVACGGYRRHLEDRHLEDPGGITAEIKRMYVEHIRPRRGLARRVLRWLEDAAFVADCCTAILECGSKQAPAHALYGICGYVGIESFSICKDRPGSRAYGKPLESSADARVIERIAAGCRGRHAQ